MAEYWNETFTERLDDTYSQGTATLTGRVDITTRVTSAELESLPQTEYVKVVVECGSARSGFGVTILPGDEPPLSTMSVADEMRALVDALPNHEFEGVLRRQAPERRGGAFSQISAFGRTVKC
jgi:hypothetical protein